MAMEYVKRPSYIEQMMEYYDNPEIVKVLTGIRRCGKSVMMELFRQHLLDTGVPERDVMLIDLEKMRYVIDSERMLYDHISGNIRSETPVILIDEVQLVKGWERVVDSVRLKYNANVYITGSNSDTVSESLGTNLTGRYVEINVFPFSFREFVDRYPIDADNGYTQRLIQYLRFGGMPIIDMKDNPRKNRTILRGVYDSIINHDIRPHMDIDQSILDNMTSFMISNVSHLTSYNNIANMSYVGDPRTVEKYLGKLCECFIFYKADRYDIIGRRHLKTNAKFYLADTGFVDAILLDSEYDKGALLENAVFMELLRRGYRVSVGSYNDREIDFTAWKDGIPEFYQVAWSAEKIKVMGREVRSMAKLEGYKRILITMDRDIRDVPEGIETLNAVDFFLQRSESRPHHLPMKEVTLPLPSSRVNTNGRPNFPPFILSKSSFTVSAHPLSSRERAYSSIDLVSRPQSLVVTDASLVKSATPTGRPSPFCGDVIPGSGTTHSDMHSEKKTLLGSISANYRTQLITRSAVWSMDAVG